MELKILYNVYWNVTITMDGIRFEAPALTDEET